MHRTDTAGHSEFAFRKETLSVLHKAYYWLATWAERNVEAGEDGQHIPQSAREALQSHTHHL